MKNIPRDKILVESVIKRFKNGYGKKTISDSAAALHRISYSLLDLYAKANGQAIADIIGYIMENDDTRSQLRKERDLSLVNDISVVQMPNGTEKNFYSFATKYCSHHRPKQYAIYDSFVDKILRYFRWKDGFARFVDGDLKNYPRFNAILNQFRQYYGLLDYDLKMTDRYLWQLGKAAFPREYK